MKTIIIYDQERPGSSDAALALDVLIRRRDIRVIRYQTCGGDTCWKRVADGDNVEMIYCNMLASNKMEFDLDRGPEDGVMILVNPRLFYEHSVIAPSGTDVIWARRNSNAQIMHMLSNGDIFVDEPNQGD